MPRIRTTKQARKCRAIVMWKRREQAVAFLTKRAEMRDT